MIRSILLLMLILWLYCLSWDFTFYHCDFLDACQISSGNVCHCRCFIDRLQNQQDHNYFMRWGENVLFSSGKINYNTINWIEFKDHLEGDFFDSLFSGGVWITAHSTSPPDQTWQTIGPAIRIKKISWIFFNNIFIKKSTTNIESATKNPFINMHQLDGGHL